jgi:hypothetical protein
MQEETMEQTTQYWITEDGIREIYCSPSQEIEYRFEGSNASTSKVVENSELEEKISQDLK